MKRTPTQNRRVRIQLNDNDGYPQRHIVRTLRAAVLLLFVSAFLSRCASMMTPHGWAARFAAPVIVNMTPDNFSTNRPLVNHEKIYIEFDEFVQLRISKGVLHLAADEEETARFAAWPWRRHPVARYARGEYDLFAQLRQRHP